MTMKSLAVAIALAASMPIAASAAGVETDPAAKTLQALVPGVTVNSVEDGPLRGWKTVVYNGTEVAYVIDQNRHVIFGNVVRSNDRHSYTVETRDELRQGVIGELPTSLRLTYKAADEKAEITVFTDVSCSFCMKFHTSNVPAYNAAGVTVHYYPAPRGGRASTAWPVMRDIWCADDPKAALSAYIADPTKHPRPAPAGCTFDTAAVEAATKALGMMGTPGVYTQQGEDLGGAAPVESVLPRLGVQPAR